MRLEISPHESPEILEATADYFRELAEIGRRNAPIPDLHSVPEKTSSEVLKFLKSWLPGMAKMLSMQKIDTHEVHTYEDGWLPNGPEEFKKAGREMTEHLQSLAPQFTDTEIKESETLNRCESDKHKESAEQVFNTPMSQLPASDHGKSLYCQETPTLPKLSLGLVDGKVELKGTNNFGTNIPKPPNTLGLITPAPVMNGKMYEPELDVRGIPYDERIHSRGKSKLSDGSWRIRRGVTDEQAREIEKEILGHDVQLKLPKIKIISQTGVTEQSSDLTPPPPPPPSEDTEELDSFDMMMDYVNASRKAGKITVAQIQEIAASISGAINMLNLSKPKNAHLVPEVHAAFAQFLGDK